MLTESNTSILQIEAVVPETAEVFMTLLGRSPKEAERLAKNLSEFSEKPIIVGVISSENKEITEWLYLTVYGRNLSLGFSKSGIVSFNYIDNNLQQRFQTKVAFEDIYYDNSISCLFIDLKNGNSLGLIKERGTVAVQTILGESKKQVVQTATTES